MKNMFENVIKYSIFIVVLGFLTWSFSPLTVFSKTTIKLNDQEMINEIEFKIKKKKYANLYRKTKNGLITQIYSHQKQNSINRGHNLPSYTNKELREWCLNKEVFHELYDVWTKSNYNKELTPSIDRLNDYKGYSFNNIRITIWKENNNKAYYDRKNGVNNKYSKAVLQYDLNNCFIKEFYSQKQAERETGIDHSNISACCKCKIKTSKGYIWRYKK